MSLAPALPSWDRRPPSHSGGALPISRRGALHLPEVQPIVVERLARQFSHPDRLFQPKYDGYRGVLYLGPRLAVIASKRISVLTRFQPLADRLQGELEVAALRVMILLTTPAPRSNIALLHPSNS